jgi:hypothetical protein
MSPQKLVAVATMMRIIPVMGFQLIRGMLPPAWPYQSVDRRLGVELETQRFDDDPGEG